MILTSNPPSAISRSSPACKGFEAFRFYPLGGHLQSLRLRKAGITVARLKRMQSIRKKLSTITGNLTQIQDLAGCRVIVPSIGNLKTIVDYNLEHSGNEHRRDYNYISHPKPDGYRCIHRVYDFVPSSDKEEIFKGRRVEIQFRTRLQHSWATAVEAVGLFRGEDIKGGSGDPNWRRLFELVSSEFAVAENSQELAGAPSHRERCKELKEIDGRINAVSTLENLSQAFNYTEMYSYEKARYFLIEYNKKDMTVRVRPYSDPWGGTKSFDNIEAEIRGGKDVNAVLVEADKIEALREAYPNYFGDVSVFKANLSRIISGREAKEYSLPPQGTMPQSPAEVPDTAWFRRPRFRSPRGI